MQTFNPKRIDDFTAAAVYVAYLFDGDEVEFAPRKTEIDECRHELHKKQKYCVWKLLEYALEKEGYDTKKIRFFKQGQKWMSDTVNFSLSHSDELTAVAISDYGVGIDVEKYKKCDDRTAKRVLSEEDYRKYLLAADRDKFFIDKWTALESLFKCGKQGTCKTVSVDDYSLTVCVAKAEN